MVTLVWGTALGSFACNYNFVTTLLSFSPSPRCATEPSDRQIVSLSAVGYNIVVTERLDMSTVTCLSAAADFRPDNTRNYRLEEVSR
jgi:hypothetical protein